MNRKMSILDPEERPEAPAWGRGGLVEGLAGEGAAYLAPVHLGNRGSLHSAFSAHVLK